MYTTTTRHACPDCGSDLSNVQGLRACTDCAWLEAPEREANEPVVDR
ncbi:MAG: hypothetical protein ABEJ04_07115 [Halobacteriaceae archaeon]